MKKTLGTKNVFLDTQVFIGINFNYQHNAFVEFIKLASSARINYYTTYITKEEIKSNIKKKIDETHSAFNSFQKDAKILRNSKFQWVRTMFDKPDYNAFQSDLIKQYEDFERETNVKEIGIVQTDIKEIFTNYFEINPPFDNGEKKYEFPDAFVISSIELWAKNNDEKIYVISADKGIQNALEDSNHLIYLKTINEFIDLYNRFDSKLPDITNEIIDNNIDDISERISEEFIELSFYLDDEDGDISDVEVEEITIEDVYVINASNDLAEIELTVNVDYSASISFLDIDQSCYDNEEGKYLFKRYIKGKIKRSDEIPVMMIISIDALRKEYLSIETIELNENQGIAISVSQHEGTFEEYYKDEED